MHKDREAEEDRTKFRELVVGGGVFALVMAGVGLGGYLFVEHLRGLFGALLCAGIVMAMIAMAFAAGLRIRARDLEDDPDTSGLAVLYERSRGKKPSGPAPL